MLLHGLLNVAHVRRHLEVYFALLDALHLLVGHVFEADGVDAVLVFSSIPLYAVDEAGSDKDDDKDSDYDDNDGLNSNLLL